MKVIITAKEALDYGVWEELCDLKGIGAWALNEGLMDDDDKIELTLVEAEKLGLLDIMKVINME